MRKTRIQHEQFWDQLNLNVDDYVQKQTHHLSPSQKKSPQLDADLNSKQVPKKDEREAGESRLPQVASRQSQMRNSKLKVRRPINATAEVKINVAEGEMLVTV